MDYSLATHADIENISIYPKEKEVLFFPFSSFEIKGIKKIEFNKKIGYEIQLLYLSKYLEELKNNKKNIKIPDSEFKKQILELGLIEQSKMKDIPQFVLKKYEEYKSKSEEIKSKDNLRLDDKSELKIIQPSIINEGQYFSNFNDLFFPRLDVKREFIEISRNPLTDLGITVGLLNENDLYEWKLSILGPKDTSYKEGLFYLNIKFPLDYPKSHPDIRFITPIYHMNIKPTKDSSDKISPPKLYFREPCEIKIILINLYSIFYWQNYKNPLCSNELVEEYLKKEIFMRIK
jgi:ubiquitin-protein ligase